MKRSEFRKFLLAGAATALLATASAASAQATSSVAFDIPTQPLGSALAEFARQSNVDILVSSQLARNQTAPALQGKMPAGEALAMLLSGTGLSYRATSTGSFVIEAAPSPQGDSAAGSGAEVEALIVTAQKREEDIQDVPIAISAFTQEDLERSQIAGGPDLVTQVPNLTFTKTNFASYSIQIRGIGTQAISATTDPAVAVAFNNTPMIRNRFFEQEFYDLQRIEVLRGPQGTLYGRNATAGVVNVISQKPKFLYEAKLSGDVSNYNSTRLEGMINIPLVEDAVAVRIAGAWTKRDGFVTNEITDSQTDGRDLWSTRVSLRFAPQDAPFDANLIWEHFEEDDDRLRSGKQLCKRHRPTEIRRGNVSIPLNTEDAQLGQGDALFSQGCTAVSLYSPEAFQAPNGFSIPYYVPLQGLGLQLTLPVRDPYLSTVQSQDLRVIESTVEPEYRAKTDIFELQFNWDLSDALTLTSETSYGTDELFSKQDLNRFNTAPGVFRNTAQPGTQWVRQNILENGVFCDPQVGCADRLVAVDLSTADSTQFSQEFRIGSDFDGPFNFSIGANFLRYDTVDKYYVFINTLTQAALMYKFRSWDGVPSPYPQYDPTFTENRECLTGFGQRPYTTPTFNGPLPVTDCIYVEPNPIGALQDRGHNYFLSKNPYKLISYAVFGEAYYNISENLKVTGGLRWTVDKKEAPRVPSMLMAGYSVGYPVESVVEQEWREPTGRLTLDWKPAVPFTDETMVYASYAHGYKAGGANPPPTAVITYNTLTIGNSLDRFATFPRTFEPEFIDAFEVGAKNTMLDGALTLNTAAFFYDYKNYQVSEIVDRSAVNKNFDATVWGVEVEADWRPIENLKLSFKGGYEKTRIADGEQAIDLMDRVAGQDDDGDGVVDWVVLRPFPTTPSNCVIPVWLATWNDQVFSGIDDFGACSRIAGGLDPVTNRPYVPNPTLRQENTGTSPPSSLFAPWSPYPANFWAGYPGYDPSSANNSQGFFKQLGGNELPNAPNWTATISADYTIPLPNEWLASLHTDLHWQSESYWRVFNDLEYDKLDEWFTMNVAAIFTNEERGWNIMAYVKNVLDKDSITGAFLFSDDVGLTTNVFLTEPRLYGLRVTKNWSGGPLLGTFGGRHEGPYPFTVELGGQVQRHDAPYNTVEPAFATQFSDAIDPADTQHQDLDWGDGREVKLIWNPEGPFKLSGGVRFGKTNGGDSALIRSELDIMQCWAAFYPCGPGTPDKYRPLYNYSDVTTTNREEHTVIDFSIGYDVGFGRESTRPTASVSAGLRHAQLESETSTRIVGVPDRNAPPNYWDFSSPTFTAANQYSRYDGTVTAHREFEGAGPTISFDASAPLVGNDSVGRLWGDLTITGGALFGDRETGATGLIREEQFGTPVFIPDIQHPAVYLQTPVEFTPRSDSATVPLLDLSVGLSYAIDRVKIGAGYRWERYFDALDTGYDEGQTTDRTIDGPYFKLSVGFGG